MTSGRAVAVMVMAALCAGAAAQSYWDMYGGGEALMLPMDTTWWDDTPLFLTAEGFIGGSYGLRFRNSSDGNSLYYTDETAVFGTNETYLISFTPCGPAVITTTVGSVIGLSAYFNPNDVNAKNVKKASPKTANFPGPSEPQLFPTWTASFEVAGDDTFYVGTPAVCVDGDEPFIIFAWNGFSDDTFSNATLVAVDAATGDTLWSMDMGDFSPLFDEPAENNPMGISPDGDNFFILGFDSAFNNEVQVYDVDSGSLLASSEVDFTVARGFFNGYFNLIPDDSFNVYVSLSADDFVSRLVVSVDTFSGNINWATNLTAVIGAPDDVYFPCSRPSLSSDQFTIYLSCGDLYALDTIDGTEQWTSFLNNLSPEYDLFAPLMLGDGNLLTLEGLASGEPEFVVVNATDGNFLAQYGYEGITLGSTAAVSAVAVGDTFSFPGDPEDLYQEVVFATTALMGYQVVIFINNDFIELQSDM